ncbi:MAG: ferric reductase-like transmembrane domain-containing protein [Alphaproteobacteria bacterium]|nr:ferric reductase-like transmembrane domain-containing protein [Alphaproteobacteria bacterium]
MRNLRRAFLISLLLPALLWLVAEPTVFQSATFFALRGLMVQFTGVLAIAAMSFAMVLALRPRLPEKWFGGLDKMYRLHKWIGITALVTAVIHWLWSQGAKWAVGWGLIARPARGPRIGIENPLEAWVAGLHHSAENLGEWAFYAALVLIVLALITRFPYRWFFKTHRLIAAAYLVLAFHAAVLFEFRNWTQPIGFLMAVLLVAGSFAAVVVLLRRVATSRRVAASITSLNYLPGMRALSLEAEVPAWPGHKAGQFAFVTSDRSEGPHPYTIASSWDAGRRRLRAVIKELGDHTRGLRDRLHVGQNLTIEGPYGCFTFEDDRPRQIWIGGGIGITPFMARLQQLAADKDNAQDQKIDLFHSTAEVDPEALDSLSADAKAAGVDLHLAIDGRHGRLTGERLRNSVPEWREASIWFCGPAGFGEALKSDLAALGFPVAERFHQELFAMR